MSVVVGLAHVAGECVLRMTRMPLHVNDATRSMGPGPRPLDPEPVAA